MPNTQMALDVIAFYTCEDNPPLTYEDITATLKRNPSLLDDIDPDDLAGMVAALDGDWGAICDVDPASVEPCSIIEKERAVIWLLLEWQKPKQLWEVTVTEHQFQVEYEFPTIIYGTEREVKKWAKEHLRTYFINDKFADDCGIDRPEIDADDKIHDWSEDTDAYAEVTSIRLLDDNIIDIVDAKNNETLKYKLVRENRISDKTAFPAKYPELSNEP